MLESPSVRLRQALEENRQQLCNARSAYLVEQHADSFDEATQISQVYITDQLVRRAYLRHIQLERAAKLDAYSTHRRCEDCDEIIPHSRLAAQPEAIRCLSCQEEWEEAVKNGLH